MKIAVLEEPTLVINYITRSKKTTFGLNTKRESLPETPTNRTVVVLWTLTERTEATTTKRANISRLLSKFCRAKPPKRACLNISYWQQETPPISRRLESTYLWKWPWQFGRPFPEDFHRFLEVESAPFRKSSEFTTWRRWVGKFRLLAIFSQSARVSDSIWFEEE